ncbi:MAG: Gfo/Idh/MocA family oxidoreductase [Lentisphaerae bacterium]|jgi:predicted dehydrogenase|nr:Gfo/Idh/MocA family oxidoreductase [Lentisphaerota bacterium]
MSQMQKTIERVSRAFSRREFVAGAGAAAGLALVSRPVFGQQAAAFNGPKIKIGIVGCGGRGSFMANLFRQHGGYEIAAAADYFQDRVDVLGEKFGVPAGHRFAGLSGYKRVLDAKPDALVVTSPPFFHPEQAEAAVDAGCHVYVAKPVAVDVPGCRTIEASGAKATAAKRVFLVDFQTRVNPFYREAVTRIHGGAIGAFAFGEASYQCGRLGKHHLHPDAGTQESRLRNWVFDKAFSGDIITEQNIHALDVMSWVFGKPPLYAYGSGARKVRVDIGDCRDTFSVIFQYPDDVAVTFNSRQFEGHGTAEGILCRVFGEKGVLETAYGGNVMIRGGEGVFYRGGETKQIYAEGAAANVAAFHAAILAGDVSNVTVAPSVQSNLITILGRTAADTGRVVTWDEVVKDTKRLDGRLGGLRS